MSTLSFPTFEFGSGWYRRGDWLPGTDADRKAMRRAAIPASVVVLRSRGKRLSPRELATVSSFRSGHLLLMDQYTAPAWYAMLFDHYMREELLPRLLHVRLVRENDGVRLYQGLQVEEREQYVQSWLCTPTPERAAQILAEMLYREANT